MKIRLITFIGSILALAAGCSEKSHKCDVLFTYTYQLGNGELLDGDIDGLNEDFYVQNVPVTEQITKSSCGTLRPGTYQQVYDSIVFTHMSNDRYSFLSSWSGLRDSNYIGIFHFVAIGWIKNPNQPPKESGRIQDEQYVGVTADGGIFLPAALNYDDRDSDLQIGMIQFSTDENAAVVMTLTGQRIFTETMDSD